MDQTNESELNDLNELSRLHRELGEMDFKPSETVIESNEF